ncbi:hypothetical protein B0H16DRAFT_1746864 [Mycena metata]|uniref:Uncharacterized protein n=1 Tax=Mycena metata TaxID=1033252 RepID=A0AAD7GW79_9AGAR|nr:hypothetical protein B0H16DRAFT_1746864 [Mycena metata]
MRHPTLLPRLFSRSFLLGPGALQLAHKGHRRVRDIPPNEQLRLHATESLGSFSISFSLLSLVQLCPLPLKALHAMHIRTMSVGPNGRSVCHVVTAAASAPRPACSLVRAWQTAALHALEPTLDELDSQ